VTPARMERFLDNLPGRPCVPVLQQLLGAPYRIAIQRLHGFRRPDPHRHIAHDQDIPGRGRRLSRDPRRPAHPTLQPSSTMGCWGFAPSNLASRGTSKHSLFREPSTHVLNRQDGAWRADLGAYRALSRPGARFRDCSRPVSPDLSPNPPCVSPRNGLSTIPAVSLLLSGSTMVSAATSRRTRAGKARWRGASPVSLPIEREPAAQCRKAIPTLPSCDTSPATPAFPW